LNKIDESQIFCFLVFIHIQNESILNTEPCGNGEEIQTLSPQANDFIRVSIIPEPTVNLFLHCCRVPGVGPFPDPPARLLSLGFKPAVHSHPAPADEKVPEVSV